MIKITNKLQGISFKDVIEVTSGYELVPINLQQKEDAELVEKLIYSSKNFLTLCNKTKRRFFGNRINEVSRAIENELVEEISKTGLKPKILPAMGYPDIELIDQHGRLTYLEIKISSIIKHSRLRSFYYTTGKKIKRDARHLLLGLLIIEEKDKYWKIEEWTLTDLSKLIVYLKAEFNASNIDIYKPELILAKSV